MNHLLDDRTYKLLKYVRENYDSKKYINNDDILKIFIGYENDIDYLVEEKFMLDGRYGGENICFILPKGRVALNI